MAALGEHIPPTAELSGKALKSTWLGVLLNACLAAFKGVAGVLGNSHALIADAMESLLDIFQGIIVASALRIAAAEPDECHPYGHGKAEPLAAIAASIGLIGAALGLAIASLRKIAVGDMEPPEVYTIFVILVVILIKELLFRYVSGVGKRIGSTAVQADAWHHRSDAITSVAALIGITIAIFGGENMRAADEWAALFACALIAYNGYRILRPALDEVMDAAPHPELVALVREVAAGVQGVAGLDTCMVRKMGFEYYVDLHVEVDGGITVHEGHGVAHRVKDAIRAAEPRVRDVLVHIEPEGGVPEADISA